MAAVETVAGPVPVVPGGAAMGPPRVTAVEPREPAHGRPDRDVAAMEPPQVAAVQLRGVDAGQPVVGVAAMELPRVVAVELQVRIGAEVPA
jgi:hypothetical protein